MTRILSRERNFADMKKIWRRIRECVPIWAAVLLGLFVVALIADAVASHNAAFATGVNEGVGKLIRGALAFLTGWLPFSLAEFLLFTSPIYVTLICVALIRRIRRNPVSGIRYFAGFLSLVSLVYTVFVFGYSTGFYSKTVAEKVGLDRKGVSPEELYDTAIALIEGAEAEIPYVFYPQGTYSSMRFSYSEMNDKLIAAYDTLCEKYPSEFPRLHVGTKPVMASEPWTYTHISGVYTVFTGEANVNVNYPDYIIVTSAAHEMAHQRGIAREDEANFVAFLVCTMSDDPYVRYCGYVDVLNEVMNDLYSANVELYTAARIRMPKEVKDEYTAYSRFFDRYRENVAANVSDVVNDAFITSHGQPAGIKSYGLVVDLAVAYTLYGNSES